MSLHELRHDLVFACELGLELLDRLVLGILDGPGLATVFEGEVGVLEELALPLVELGRIDLELVTQVGNGDALEEVAFDDSDLLLG